MRGELRSAVFNIFVNSSVIEQLDAKTTIMNHLTNNDANVKHQALLCIQKLMIHHWEYLSKIEWNEGSSNNQPGSSGAGQPKSGADGRSKTVDTKASA